MNNETNKYWKRYEKGYDYIIKKNLISRTQRNWNFYVGKQWEGIETGGEELPFLNFIKRTIRHKVSTVSQNNMVVHYSDVTGRDDLESVYETLGLKFSEVWEKANMDQNLWKVTNDAAVTGDGVIYFGSSDPADMERIQNTSVLYGDESIEDIQTQPYIIIHQRLAIGQIKQIAEENGLSDEEIAKIVPDEDTEKLVGNRQEIEHESISADAKATCIIHLEKKPDGVYVARATRNVVFAPEKLIAAKDLNGNVVRALHMYPLVKMTWENYPNDARGVSEVEQMIPNQLEVNKTIARIAITNKQVAYPRPVYDSEALMNPDALGEVGTPIEMQSGGVQSVNQLITYLEPAQISGEPRQFLENLLSLTQELSGAGETAMGNINPTRVAASAIIAIRDQAALPLNEQVEKRNTFVEDLAKLVIEMVAVYEPNGFTVQEEVEDPMTGQTHHEPRRVTSEELLELQPRVRIDTSQDNPWTKEAEQNWLDGVLDKGHITFNEYIDAAPDHGIIPKNKMQHILEKRQQQMAMQQMQQGAVDEMGNPVEETGVPEGMQLPNNGM